MAYSPHLNGEKLTQREGAIAQYNLAEAHANRIKETISHQLLAFLPGYRELVDSLTPEVFAERFRILVRNTSDQYRKEEERLIKETPDVWGLWNNSTGVELFSPALSHEAVSPFMNRQILPKGVKQSRAYDKYLRHLSIPVRKGVSHDYEPTHLMFNYPSGGPNRRQMTYHTQAQEGMIEAIADEKQLTIPNHLLRNPLKTEEELDAIIRAAKEGVPIIEEALKVQENHRGVMRAINAELKP